MESNVLAVPAPWEPATTVERLSAYLRDNLPSTSLAAAAKSLQMSRRTLQRLLLRAGLSFRAVLRRVRVERTKELLMTPVPLVTIAVAVGLCKSEHLRAQFRAVVGVTPQQWRRLRAAADAVEPERGFDGD